MLSRLSNEPRRTEIHPTMDDLTLSVSSETLKARCLDTETFVWAYNGNYGRPFFLTENNDIHDGIVCISQIAANNLSLDVGSPIYLHHQGDIPVVNLAIML